MARFGRFVFAVIFAAAIGLAGGDAGAAGSSDSSSSSTAAQDTEYAKAEKAVKAMDYAGAIPLPETVVSKAPRNADALNYLGYSHRKLGRFDDALAWSGKALAVDPDHKGANEYLGELHLQMGNLVKAEERLAHLDKVCFFGCEEFDDLKKAIAAYKQKS